jgi:DNA integrity scanning protein DisA with diadenylate cyclase activity
MEKVEKILVDIALKICKQRKGCMFVIMNNPFDYAPLIEQDIKPFSIFDNQRRLETLALVDGACIINPQGNLIAYAVQILNVKPRGYGGTRHQASYTASLNGNIVIISSEEDAKVRIFKEGKLVIQIDSLEKNIETRTSEAVSFLESIGVGTIGTIGVSVLAPSFGLTLIPGVIIFGTAHYLSQKLFDKKR